MKELNKINEPEIDTCQKPKHNNITNSDVSQHGRDPLKCQTANESLLAFNCAPQLGHLIVIVYFLYLGCLTGTVDSTII